MQHTKWALIGVAVAATFGCAQPAPTPPAPGAHTLLPHWVKAGATRKDFHMDVQSCMNAWPAEKENEYANAEAPGVDETLRGCMEEKGWKFTRGGM